MYKKILKMILEINRKEIKKKSLFYDLYNNKIIIIIKKFLIASVIIKIIV